MHRTLINQHLYYQTWKGDDLMANFYDTSVGQQAEFQRVLASVGFTDANTARAIDNPDKALAMHKLIQPIPAPTNPP